jgi:hypothetical protein
LRRKRRRSMNSSALLAMGASLERVGTRLLEQARPIGYRFVRA